MNVLVAGGTGFVGRRLVEALAKRGDVVTVVSRDPSLAQRDGIPGASYRGWLPPLDAYHAVVNLAGENLFGHRWNARVKQRLRESRLSATHRLAEAVAAAPSRPRVLVNASAVGFYGDRGSEPLPESATPGTDFLARLCRDWENEAQQAPCRVVLARFGVVLGPGGGALKKMLLPFRLGIGGPIGLGRNYFPWIHRDDLVSLVLWTLDTEAVSGPVNVVSPGAVTNAEFSRALGRSLHRPAFLPVPPPALRLAFGEVAAVLTASQRCIPDKAQRLGFRFRHAEIEAALADIVGSERPAAGAAGSMASPAKA